MDWVTSTSADLIRLRIGPFSKEHLARKTRMNGIRSR